MKELLLFLILVLIMFPLFLSKENEITITIYGNETQQILSAAIFKKI